MVISDSLSLADPANLAVLVTMPTGDDHVVGTKEEGKGSERMSGRLSLSWPPSMFTGSFPCAIKCTV